MMRIVLKEQEGESGSNSLAIRSFLQGIRWLWLPLTVFLVTRLGIVLVAYLGVGLVAEPTVVPPYHLRGVENLFIDVFGSRWDTGFYVSIAEEGYFYQDVPLPSVAFFPLYPLMMRALGAVVGDVVLAGILISHAALLLATILFYRLTTESWGEAVAGRAVWYLLIFPVAFFGSVVYTESLFLLWVIGALYFGRKGYWEVAALMGIAATMTRFVGLIVTPMLLLEWWRQQRGGLRPSWWGVVAAGAVPWGLLAYMGFLWQRFNDPLAFLHGAAAWGRQPQSPLTTVLTLLESPAGGWSAAFFAGGLHFDNWFDLLCVLLFLGLGLVLVYWRRWPEAVFVLSGVVIAFGSGLLMSQRRYMWILFPAFIVLAKWGDRPWVDKLVTVVSLMLLGLFTAMFANGYWVG